jgi:hypothetical protein
MAYLPYAPFRLSHVSDVSRRRHPAGLASRTEEIVMSRSVDLFIDADVPLDELASALERHTGTQLVAEPDQPQWVLQEGDTRATLAEHPYGDDGDLLFSRYRFALSARVSNDVRPHETAEAALLRRVAQKIQQGPTWPILLVHDLQYCERVQKAPSEGVARAGS